MPDKLFLVKREVMAKDIKEAMTKTGKIYEIQEAGFEEDEEEKVGFKNNNKKTKC